MKYQAFFLCLNFFLWSDTNYQKKKFMKAKMQLSMH